MKLNLILAAVFAFSAMPAFATKARLVALGEETTGSLYFKDSRNIFLNAASVNDVKNTVILEWGSDGAPYTPSATPTSVRTAKQDADNNNQGEGGVFYGWNDMVVGVYLGGETFQVQDARRYLNLQNRIVHQDNQLDLFVGGGAGMKWGVNATYSKVEDDSIDAKGQSGSVRFGVMESRWEAYASVALVNKFEGDLNSSGTDEDFDGKLGYEVGGNFDTGKGKVFAFWRHAGWDQESDNAISATPGTANGGAYVGKAEVKVDKYIVGYGHEAKLGDKAVLFYKAQVVMNKREFKSNNDGKATLDDKAVPLTIGLEHDSASWLTLRGSVSQNLWGQADNDYDTGLAALVSPLITGSFADGKRTMRNTTNVNAGATVKFGDFAIDGLLGTGTGSTATESGVFDTDNLMSRVAMTYKF